MTEHQYVSANDIYLHVVQDGPEDGPLLILLHGFPEFWRGWIHQIPFFASRGYRVLAPDQRGYNLSDKPAGIDAYNRDALAADIVGLIRGAGRERAYIVGHDWGGVVSWWLGIKYPQHVKRLVILNAPHPTALSRLVRTNWEQRLRSMYAAFFQLPWLPELALRAGNWQTLAWALVGSSRPGTFSAADLERYREAWARPGSMTAMLNWYRAVPRVPIERLASLRVTVPTRIIWGLQDVALARELAPMSLEMCDEGKLFFLEEASHWVQHEEADLVHELINSFFAS